MPTDPELSLQASDAEPAAEMAREVQRLSEALITRQLSNKQALAVADALSKISDSVVDEPQRTKAENFGLRNRISTFFETGAWPPPPPDGTQIEFDVASPVGGLLNPVSVGAQYFRDGDEVIGRVNVGRCFEGPPERVHGGVICAIFDEVMGSVFRATGAPSAFTGELSVRFEAPAPIQTDLEFRARIVSTEGRKQFMSGEAVSPDGQFASATATFVEMRVEHFADMSEQSGAAGSE